MDGPPGCTKCADQLAYLERQGYFRNIGGGWWQSDNCGSGAKGCEFLNAQPVNGFPACSVWRSTGDPRPKRAPEGDTCQPVTIPCPSPSPSQPPQGGPSDVARINIFHFDNADQGCKIKGQPFVVPLDPPCKHREIHVTLTPKADPPCAVSNCDAQQHGRNVTWWAAGQVVPDSSEGVDVGCAIVGPMDSEPTFNRYIKATGKPCRNGFSLKVQLVAPDGKVFTAEKTVEVQ